MAVTIDWPTGVINIPKADTTFVSNDVNETRSLDLVQLWKDLRTLEDSDAGRPFPRVVDHDSPKTYGATTLGHGLIITDYYTVTFEDGNYRVLLLNANSNVSDRLNLNSVQVIPNNSAGLQIVTSGSGVTPQDKADIIAGVWSALRADSTDASSMGELMNIVFAMTYGKVTRNGDIITVYNPDDGVTAVEQFNLANKERIPI